MQNEDRDFAVHVMHILAPDEEPSLPNLRLHLERLFNDFFAGEVEGDLEYEGDSYSPTRDTLVFIPDDQTRDRAEAQLLQIGGRVVEPFVEDVTRRTTPWPARFSYEEHPRVIALLSKLAQDPAAVEPLYKAFDHALERVRAVLGAALASIGDERAVETLRRDRERSEAQRRQREEEERRKEAEHAEFVHALAKRDEAKRAEAERAEQAKRYAIQFEREAARVCVLCGKPLGLLRKLFGAKQHKECTTFCDGQSQTAGRRR
jgi:hypothetical protein